MAKAVKRPLKRKVAVLKGDRGSDKTGIFGLSTGMKVFAAAAAVVIVAAAFVLFREPDAPQPRPAGGTAGAVPLPAEAGGRSADAQAVPNRPPAVGAVNMAVSDPDASTPLRINYQTSDPDGDEVAVEIKWFVDGALVQSGPSNELLPGSYRKGSRVYAEVTPSDREASGSVQATAPVTIRNAPPKISALVLEPDPIPIGAVITATPSGADPDGDPVSYLFQWRVNGSPVERANGGNRFDTSGLRKQDAVSITVEATDGERKSGNSVARTVMLQNRKPEFVSSPPTSLQSGVYLYQAQARDPDGDAVNYRLGNVPAGMTIDPSSGSVRWEPPKGTIYAGRHEVPVSIIASDGDGGTAVQEFAIVLENYLAY